MDRLMFKKEITNKFLIIYFPNNLEDDLRILKILEEVENSDGGFNK